MSVSGSPELRPDRMIAALDQTAGRTVKRAQEAVIPVVATETPHGSTGKVAAALRPKVSRTTTGYALGVRAPRGTSHDRHATIAQVVRWLNRGTGIYRTTGLDAAPARKIRSKRHGRRMVLPGGKKYWTVKGQKPNPFMDRIYARSTPRVEQIYRDGASDAARAMEATIR